jgi:hypothetical protein
MATFMNTAVKVSNATRIASSVLYATSSPPEVVVSPKQTSNLTSTHTKNESYVLFHFLDILRRGEKMKNFQIKSSLNISE